MEINSSVFKNTQNETTLETHLKTKIFLLTQKMSWKNFRFELCNRGAVFNTLNSEGLFQNNSLTRQRMP